MHSPDLIKIKYQDIKNITIFHNNIDKRSIAEYVKRMNPTRYMAEVYNLDE